MTTDKSILKGWFSTGLKPEQEQFWAWMDSYYHKKDLVPMAAVEGLENALTKKAEASSLQYFAVKDGSNITETENWKSKLGVNLLDTVKANKDASGLSVQNIESWKNTLGVGEIPDNMATNDGEDDDGNPVSGTSYTKEQSDGKYYPKVSSQYFNSNYVLLADGSPKAAGDLGKNVANSSLTSLTGAGLTLGAAWTMNTAGQNYALTGLNDVSANSAFSALLTQNAAGQIGKSNGKQPFLNMPSVLSDAEKTAWKTNMNGGWTTNTMSVGVISPPVVDQKDRPYWINLKGTNLNLPPTNFNIELCTANSVSANTATVVAEIPASQVQLYTSGIDLILYYNFKNIPTGQYKIRLWNGVAWYLTGLTISVVAQIQRVDLDNIVWEKKIYNNAASSVITQSGSSVNYSSDSNVKALGDDSSYIAARKTNQLIAADEDFYMTVEMSGKTAIFTNANGSMTHFVGLVNPANPIDLLNQTLINVRLVQSYWYPMAKIYADSSNVSSNVSDTTYSFSVTFIRRGGSWTIIVYHNNQTFIYTKTGYTGAIAFGMYNMNTAGATGVSANIVELYRL